jgi:hypothetical protein
MTEYYNNDEINGRHLVLFSPPKKQDKWYYVFEEKRYVKCTPLNNLPYDLCSFQLDIQTPDNKVVITSNDSYKLKNYWKEYTNPNDIEKKYRKMCQEKEWRDSIVKEGAEMDFLVEGKGWTKAKVCWPKADIISGVILVGPRACPNMGSFGYFYKESRKFAKSCRYTRVIPLEELDREEREKQETRKRIKQQKLAAEEWKEKIGIKNVQENYSATKFVDTIQHYKTLNKYDTPITLQHLLEITNDEKQAQNFREIDTKGEPNGIERMGFVAFQILKDRQVVYNIHKREIKEIVSQDTKDIAPDFNFDKCFRLVGSDGYSDIKVFNATYAYLVSGYISNVNESKTRIDFTRVGDSYTLPDITYENPLFAATSGSSLVIYTDGTDIEYRYIFLDANVRTLWCDFGNGFAITHFPSLGRILFTGHVFNPSFSRAYEELINVPYEKKEKEENIREVSFLV